MTAIFRPRIAWPITLTAAVVTSLVACAPKTSSVARQDGSLVTAASSDDGTWRYRQAVASDAQISVRGIEGAIEVTAADANEVEIEATKPTVGDADNVDIQVVETSAGLIVCAVYPDGECSESGDLGRFDALDDTVDVHFAVTVPKTSTVHAQLVNGPIRVTGLRGAAMVQTVNGALDVDAGASVQAQTVNGTIRASLHEPGSVRGALQTVNGRIELHLVEGVSASLKAASANGNIESDFGLSTHASGYGPSAATLDLGEDGGDLDLESVNGGIAIRRLARL